MCSACATELPSLHTTIIFFILCLACWMCVPACMSPSWTCRLAARIDMVPLSPPVCLPPQVDDLLRERGYAVIDAAGLVQWLHMDVSTLQALCPFWNRLPPDAHLKDGG